MAVGNYIYVGKSRLRRIKREKRRKRREEVRRKSLTPSGGSPCSGRIRYAALTSLDDGDDTSLHGHDVEADNLSIGSSGSEDLLPLLDIDIELALQLHPLTDIHLQRIKMPFELFKKKEKKKPEPEKIPEPEQKKELPTKEEVNKAVQIDDEVKDEVLANDKKDQGVESVDTEETLLETQTQTEKPEPVTESLASPKEITQPAPEEEEQHELSSSFLDGTFFDNLRKFVSPITKPPEKNAVEKELKDDAPTNVEKKSGKVEAEPVEDKSPETQQTEPVEPEPELEVPKDDVKLMAPEEVYANGKTEKEPLKLEPVPLKLDKVYSDEEADKRMGVICCSIL